MVAESMEWTTDDEISFLKLIALKRHGDFMHYRELILRGKRAWDSTVDVGRIKRFLLGV